MKTSNYLHTTKALALIGFIVGTGSAHQTLAQNESNSMVIEEIMVTAQKREESIQDIPLSVKAVSQKDLERMGALKFEDYARGQAGVVFSSAGRSSRGGNIPVIRGISQLNPQGPSSAFYIDETPLQPQETEHVGMPDPNMFDINRVEILRGPQGDLFGSSAMGGTIRVIPNRPDAREFEGRVDFKLGAVKTGGNDTEANAMVNIPLVENKLALRLAATQAKDAGFVDLLPEPALGTSAESNVNEVDARSIRAALRWDVSDKLSITPSIFWQKTEEDRGRFVSHDLSRASGDYLDINYGLSEFSNNEFKVGNLLVEYDLGWGMLTSSTTSYALDWDNQVGTTGINNLLVGGLDPQTLNDAGSEDQFVQELRVASSLGGPFNFIFGAFYRDIEHKFAQNWTVPSFIPDFGTDEAFTKIGEVEKLKEKALFGQATWKFNESWEAAVGMRQFDYERERLTPTTSGVFGFAERNTGAEENGVSPTYTLRYFATEDAMIYGRASEGFRPGFGFATIFPSVCNSELQALGLNADDAVGQVDADKVRNYEVGAKTSWLGNRLVVNASAYRIDWEDIQTAVNLDCGFVVSSNGGEAQVDGFELEVQAVPVESLNLALSLGRADAVLTEDAPGIGGFDGDTLHGVPEWTAGASAEYSFPIAGNPGYVRVGYSYTGEYFNNFSKIDKSPRNRHPSLGLFDMRLGVNYEKWEFALFAKNLTNEKDLGVCKPESPFRLLQPDYSTCGVKPRVIGFNIGYHFN